MNIINALSQPLTNYAISAELLKKTENNDYSFTTSFLLFAKVANAAAVPLSFLSCSAIVAASFGCNSLSNQFNINVLHYLDPLFNTAYAAYLIYQLTLGVQLAPALALASLALVALNSHNLLPGSIDLTLHAALPVVDLIWSFTAKASLFDKIGSIFLDLCLVSVFLPIGPRSDKDWLPDTPTHINKDPTPRELASIVRWKVVPEYIYRPISDENQIHLALAKWREKILTQSVDLEDRVLNDELHLTTRHLFRTHKGEEKFKETFHSSIVVILYKIFLSFTPNKPPTLFDIYKVLQFSNLSILSMYTNGRIDKLIEGLSKAREIIYNDDLSVEAHIDAINDIISNRKDAKIELCKLGIIKLVGTDDTPAN